MKVDYSKYWDTVKFWKQVVEERDNFLGTSPPAVFVGSSFYPKVNLGVLSPPKLESDAGALDNPELWYRERSSLGDILNYRSRMVYSRSKVSGVSPAASNKIVDAMQELAVSSKSLDVEIKLSKKPSFAFQFDSYASPIGNPAPVEKIRVVDNPTVGRAIDRAVGDSDLRTVDALEYLRRGGVPVSQIQKILSVGLLGVKGERRLVPTRWSITAVDSNLGNLLVDEIKDYQEVDKPALYRNEYLFNDYQVLLLPGKYRYELVEIDLTGSMENSKVGSDFEPYAGRTKYARETAGGFYAARLGVLEGLARLRRQATVLVVRETKPEYTVPVGVWEVRETVRGAFEARPRTFETPARAFDGISENAVTKDLWKRKSFLYKQFREQLELVRFF